MLKQYVWSDGYEFNYEYNVFQPKDFNEKTLDWEVNLDGRIGYFIKDVYKKFYEHWEPIERKGIASLKTPSYVIHHSLVEMVWTAGGSGEPQLSVVLSYNFKNKGIEDAFYKLLNSWGAISSDRSYAKEIFTDKSVRFNKHVDSLKSWLSLIDLIMIYYKYGDISDSFNDCAQDLDIKHSNGSITYEPNSLMASVAHKILGSGLGTCNYCSDPFIKKRKDNIYCSNSCRVRYKQNNNRRKLS